MGVVWAALGISAVMINIFICEIYVIKYIPTYNLIYYNNDIIIKISKLKIKWKT